MLVVRKLEGDTFLDVRIECGSIGGEERKKNSVDICVCVDCVAVCVQVKCALTLAWWVNGMFLLLAVS